MSDNYPGLKITIEGTDCSGKDTISYLLAKALNEWVQGRVRSRITIMKQPTDPYRGEIEQVPPQQWMRHLYLFIRDREARFPETKQYLEHGHIVLMVRDYHSSCVYQGLMGQQSPQDILQAHGIWAIKPDVTCILDVDVEEAMRRKEKRGDADLQEFEDREILRASIERYRALPNITGFEECSLIPAAGRPEEVSDRLWVSLLPVLNEWASNRQK